MISKATSFCDSQNTEISVLSDQLCDYFDDNMRKDQIICLLRDEILELRSELFEMDLDYRRLEDQLIQMTSYRNLKQKIEESDNKLIEIEKDFSNQMDRQNEQCSKILSDLSEGLDSITILSEQVSSASFEESIKSFENHNEKLVQSVQEYDKKLSESNLSNELLQKKNMELTKKLYEKQQEVEKLKLENIRYKSQLNLQNNLCKTVFSPTYTQNYSEALSNRESSQRLSNELEILYKRASDESFKREESEKSFSKKIEMLDTKVFSLEASLDKKDKELNRAKDRLSQVLEREDHIQSELDLNLMRIDEIENEKYLLKKEIEKLNENRMEEKNQLSKLSIELKTSKSILTKQTTRIDLADKCIKALRVEIGRLKHMNDALKTELSSSQKQYAALGKSSYSLKEDVAKLEGKVVLYASILDSSQNECDQFKQENFRLIAVEEKHEQTLAHNKEMIEILEELQMDYSKLKDDYNSILTVREQAVNALETARSWQQEHKDRESVVQLMIENQKRVIKSLIDDRRNLKVMLKELHRDFIIVNHKRQQYEDELKKNYPHYSYKYRTGRMTRYNSYPDFFGSTDVINQIKSATKQISRARIDWQSRGEAAYHSDAS